MFKLLVVGAGKIGELIAAMLAESGAYEIHLADLHIQHFHKDNLGDVASHVKLVPLDAADTKAMQAYVETNGIQGIISSLPYYCNPAVAQVAKDTQVHYFDLTEDTRVTEEVTKLANGAKTAFVPQCGLAPGFISIAANDVMSHFDEVADVAMRVGALPQYPNNTLKYALTWSTDGLINEYGNPCFAILNGEGTWVQPLEGLETIVLRGREYEAFNTSGGLGSLAQTYAGRVKNMNYKTMRYPGHCHYMQLLMNDLKLNEDRDTFKRILEKAVPKTMQDVVMVYVVVKGQKSGHFMEESFLRKIYPTSVAGRLRSAIQVTTSAGICAVVDLILQSPQSYQGLVKQEQFPLHEVLENRFGQYYNEGEA